MHVTAVDGGRPRSNVCERGGRSQKSSTEHAVDGRNMHVMMYVTCTIRTYARVSFTLWPLWERYFTVRSIRMRCTAVRHRAAYCVVFAANATRNATQRIRSERIFTAESGVRCKRHATSNAADNKARRRRRINRHGVGDWTQWPRADHSRTVGASIVIRGAVVAAAGRRITANPCTRATRSHLRYDTIR